MHYQIQEGYITLETGDWQDRSINMLAANHLPVKGTNLVITRELLPDGLTFADYITNQKTELAKALKGFKLISDAPDTINEKPAHFLELNWDNQGTAMHQMIFVIDNTPNMLNLTTTVPGTIDDTTRATLLAAMKSFKTGPVPVEQKGVAK